MDRQAWGLSIHHPLRVPKDATPHEHFLWPHGRAGPGRSLLEHKLILQALDRSTDEALAVSVLFLLQTNLAMSGPPVSPTGLLQLSTFPSLVTCFLIFSAAHGWLQVAQSFDAMSFICVQHYKKSQLRLRCQQLSLWVAGSQNTLAAPHHLTGGAIERSALDRHWLLSVSPMAAVLA